MFVWGVLVSRLDCSTRAQLPIELNLEIPGSLNHETPARMNCAAGSCRIPIGRPTV